MGDNRRIEDYCTIISRLNHILDGMNYIVLKLYKGHKMAEGAGYKPRDVDIFVGSNPQAVYSVLEVLKTVFSCNKIKVVKKRTFLDPKVTDITIIIPGYSVEIDLYTEITFSPISVLNSSPSYTSVELIPWCNEIRVPTLEGPLNVLYILTHALHHINLRGHEILSLVEELNRFNVVDIVKFLSYARRTGIEEITLILLKLIVYYAKYVFKLKSIQYPSFYTNVYYITRVLTDTLTDSQKRVAYMALRGTLSRTRVSDGSNVELLPVFILYILKSIVLVIRDRSKNSTTRLLRIILMYFYGTAFTFYVKAKSLKVKIFSKRPHV